MSPFEKGLFGQEPEAESAAKKSSLRPPSDLVTANVDGGSRGNPGPAGYGVLLRDGNGKTIAELSEYLGHKTNNHAEYSALLAALKYAHEHGIQKLKVISDSELLVKHMQRQYRVNSPDLKPLYEEAQQMASGLEYFRIEHVLRERNHDADRLANLAMDRGTGRAPARSAAESAPKTTKPESKEFNGVVRNGHVELIDVRLAEGTRVKIRVE